MSAVAAQITRRIQEEAEEDRAPHGRRCPAARRGRAACYGDRTALGGCERGNRRLVVKARAGLSRLAAMHSRMGAGVGLRRGRSRGGQDRRCESRSLRNQRPRRRRSQPGRRQGHARGRVMLVREHELDGLG